MRIDSYIKRGNSFPLIINDKGNKYFVKLRAGMSNQYGLINEWFGNKLGKQLGINTQHPIWIDINRKIKTENIYIEVKELAHKSMGLNIGFEYQKDAIEIDNDDLKDIDNKELRNIFLFDLMMINIDRTSHNLNMMKVDNEIFALDFESSLLVKEIIEHKQFLNNPNILQCFRNNPLYQEIDDDGIDEFIKQTKNISIEKILAEIPTHLLSKEYCSSFIKKIEEKQNNDWFLKEIMRNLKKIKFITQEEQKKRAYKNQINFIRNLKSNKL